MKNGDLPAYACSDNGTENTTTWEGQKGLTKRELIAAMALQAIITANPERMQGGVPLVIAEDVAMYAIEYADELLKQLES